MTDENIFAKIQETLVDALGVDDDEITPEATLVGDLGAESIDFLDIVFRLERVFDIKIPKGELFPENLTSSNPEYVDDGLVTESGMNALREKLPHADFDELVSADASDTQAVLYVMQVSLDGSPPGPFSELIEGEEGRGDARFGLDDRGRVFIVSRQTNVIYLTDLIAD